VGTEIYRDPASAKLDAEWEAALEKGWNREALLALASRIPVPGLVLQPASEQRPYKISFHVGGEVRLSQTRVSRELIILQKPDAVVEALRVAIGVDAARVIYSSSKDVDILPLRASKGAAAAFLLSQLASEAELPALTLRACALVAGDSGNDIELFALRTRGVVVGNARPELAAWADAHPSPHLLRARASAADGVVEALHHFRIITASI
jgi:sucrose-6F-phosphate phosphohydrolase